MTREQTYQGLRDHSSETSTEQLRHDVATQHVGKEGMLKELVEIELESGEGCDLHYIDTVTFEEPSPSFNIPHVLESLRHI